MKLMDDHEEVLEKDKKEEFVILAGLAHAALNHHPVNMIIHSIILTNLDMKKEISNLNHIYKKQIT